MYIGPTPGPTPGSTPSTTGEDETILPIVVPIAKREESLEVVVGTAPPDWPLDIPRQSDDSQYDLIDPPIVIPDPYGWLRNDDLVSGTLLEDDSSVADIMSYIQEEMAYTQDAYFAKPEIVELQDEIKEEMLSYVHKTYFSFPITDIKTGYYYYSRVFEGLTYEIHCRAPIPPATDNTSFVDAQDYLSTQLKLWDGTPDMSILRGEEVYLDENLLAEDHDYFHIGSHTVQGSYIVYTIDTTAYERYEVIIQRIGTDEIMFKGADTANLSFNLDQTSGEIVWVEQQIQQEHVFTLFVVQKEEASNRSYRVDKCTFNFSETTAIDCEILAEETDIKFNVGISKTSDEEYLLIESSSKDTYEIYAYHFKHDQMVRVAPRRHGIRCYVDHGNGYWWMLTNEFSENWDIMYSHQHQHRMHHIGSDADNVEMDDAEEEVVRPLEWELVLDIGANFDSSPKDGIKALHNYILIQGREEPFGLPQIWIIKLHHQSKKKVESVISILDNVNPQSSCYVGNGSSSGTTGPAHSIDVVDVGPFETSTLVVSYESLTYPRKYYRVDLDGDFESDYDNFKVPPKNETSYVSLLYETQIAGYEEELYCSERMLVPSRTDESSGEIVMIPVSVHYRKDTMIEALEQHPVPLHLYGYGAYGTVIENLFDNKRLPLLDRGVMYVVASIRGSGDLGETWYNDGKMLRKKKTFTDFIDVAKYLIHDKEWTAPDLLSCEGRSAGGLLIGAVLNLEPGLFRAAILGVPFVDVIATMSDASIPLTSMEWEEWGNPNEEELYAYMKSYEPLSNIQSDTKYPSMLIEAGLHDSRVAYWGPTKYVATLRHTLGQTQKESTYPFTERPVFLQMGMSSGHFGGNNRYSSIDQKAATYAFVINQIEPYDWEWRGG